jgi:hypothetical protein
MAAFGFVPAAERIARNTPLGPPVGEMRVAALFGLGSCLDVGAVLTPGADRTLSLFQGRCVARVRAAPRQTWCPLEPDV